MLDITPSAIEQLNYAECYPIVIYFQVSDRRMIKQIRHEYGKFYQKSSRRLWEVADRLEHFYSYLFTSIIKVDSTHNWYEILKAQIEFQQEQSIWMSHDRSIEKDFLKSEEYFLSTNDLDESSHQFLQRVASDSSMFHEEDDRISLQTSTISLPSRSHSAMELPSTDRDPFLHQRSLPNATNYLSRAEKYRSDIQLKVNSTNSLPLK